MKKYITAALLFCAALTAACSKETAGSADTGDTGALEMRVSATRAEADGEYDPLQRLAVRIYRASGELLRQYTAETLPSRLELLAGEYRVEVDAGEAVPASFTKRFYKGEKTFTVAAGQTTVAEVECKRQNVVAEVKFDATVSAAFGENFHAWVVAADAFDEGQVQQGGVPALNYTADGTGYFTMPEGATTLTTRFEGTHPDRGVIVREARFEGVQTGGKYSVSFRFSKDLPGFIECFVVKVDTSTDDYDDTFPFSPEPSIESDGFDMDQPQDFIPGTTSPKRYMITTMAAVKSVVIGIGDDSYEALNGTTEGVEVTRESDLSLTVTLSDAFFAGRPGGSHPVSIRVTDSAGAEATAISEYRLQGLLPIEKTDYDLWTNSLTLRALVLDPNVTTATFGLRVKDGEWSDAEGVNAGEGIYTATFTAQWKESVNAAGLTVHTPVAGTGRLRRQQLRGAGGARWRNRLLGRVSGRCRAGHPRRGYGKRITPLFRQKHVGIHDVLGQRQCRNFETVCAVDQTRHGRQLLRQARIAAGVRPARRGQSLLGNVPFCESLGNGQFRNALPVDSASDGLAAQIPRHRGRRQ